MALLLTQPEYWHREFYRKVRREEDIGLTIPKGASYSLSEGIEMLPLETKHKLLRLFYANVGSLEQKGKGSALRSLAILGYLTVCQSIKPDPYYLDFIREKDERFSDLVMRDDQFRYFVDSWKSDDESQLASFSRYIEARQNEHYEVFPITFGRVHKISHHYDPGMNLVASYDETTLTIAYNMLKIPNALKYFLSTFHEKRHDHQFRLACASVEGRIPKKSPYYEQAKRFVPFFDLPLVGEKGPYEHVYVTGETSTAANDAQAIEDDSSSSEARLKKNLAAYFQPVTRQSGRLELLRTLGQRRKIAGALNISVPR